jgi:multiple sugar transport system ATP-binding protein
MLLPDRTTPSGAEEYPEFIPVSMAERAIVRHPQVFLFDEPRSNLDAKLRVQIRVERKRLHTRLETTAIYVTHDQIEAMTLGTGSWS